MRHQPSQLYKILRHKVFLGSILGKNLSNLVFFGNYLQNLRLLLKQIWAVKFVATFYKDSSNNFFGAIFTQSFRNFFLAVFLNINKSLYAFSSTIFFNLLCKDSKYFLFSVKYSYRRYFCLFIHTVCSISLLIEILMQKIFLLVHKNVRFLSLKLIKNLLFCLNQELSVNF